MGDDQRSSSHGQAMSQAVTTTNCCQHIILTCYKLICCSRDAVSLFCSIIILLYFSVSVVRGQIY